MQLSLKSIISNASYLFAGGIGGMGLGLLQSIIVARGLGASQLGNWSIIVSLCSLIQAVFSFRTQEPLTRYLIEYRQNKERDNLVLLVSTAIFTDLLTNIVTLILIVLVSPLVIKHLSIESSPGLMIFYGGSFLFKSFDATWYCIARDQKKLAKQSTRQFLTSLFQSLSIIATFYIGLLNLTSLASVIFVTSFLSGIYVLILLNKGLIDGYDISIATLIRQNYINSFEKLIGFWSFMKSTFVSNIFTSLIKNVDVLILGYFWPPAVVGHYQVAKSLISTSRLAVQSLSLSVYQDINQLIQSKKSQELHSQLVKATFIFLPRVLLLSIALALLVYPIVRFLYGDTYIPSYFLYLNLLIGSIVGANLFWAQPLILALDLYRYNLKVTLFSGVISTLASVLATPLFGSVGLSIVNSLTMISIHLSLAIRGLKQLEVRNES